MVIAKCGGTRRVQERSPAIAWFLRHGAGRVSRAPRSAERDRAQRQGEGTGGRADRF